MKENYKIELMASIHEMIEGFHRSNTVDEKTMREFDEACLTALQSDQNIFDALMRIADETQQYEKTGLLADKEFIDSLYE